MTGYQNQNQNNPYLQSMNDEEFLRLLEAVVGNYPRKTLTQSQLMDSLQFLKGGEPSDVIKNQERWFKPHKEIINMLGPFVNDLYYETQFRVFSKISSQNVEIV